MSSINAPQLSLLSLPNEIAIPVFLAVPENLPVLASVSKGCAALVAAILNDANALERTIARLDPAQFKVIEERLAKTTKPKLMAKKGRLCRRALLEMLFLSRLNQAKALKSCRLPKDVALTLQMVDLLKTKGSATLEELTVELDGNHLSEEQLQVFQTFSALKSATVVVGKIGHIIGPAFLNNLPPLQKLVLSAKKFNPNGGDRKRPGDIYDFINPQQTTPLYKHLPTLEELHTKGFEVRVLSEVAKRGTNLKRLTIEQASVFDQWGIRDIAKSLTGLKALQLLNPKGKQFEKGVSVLTIKELLTHLTSLETLGLTLPEYAIDSINGFENAPAAQHVTELSLTRYLPIRSNRYQYVEGPDHNLGPLLSRFPNVRSLTISGIDGQDVAPLCDSLKCVRKITILPPSHLQANELDLLVRSLPHLSQLTYEGLHGQQFSYLKQPSCAIVQ